MSALSGRVIARYDALVLQREDQVEILAPERHESSTPLTGRLGPVRFSSLADVTWAMAVSAWVGKSK